MYDMVPGEDYSPRLIVVTDGAGAEVWRSRFRTRFIDDRWFPVWMSFDYNGEPMVTVDVLHAEFNKATHPRELDPGAELGMLPGTNMTVWTGGTHDLRY